VSNDDALERICELADRIDNLCWAITMPIPDRIHVECLKGSLPEIRDELKKCLKELGYHPWEEG